MSDWLAVAKETASVHAANHLGWVFYTLVREHKPLVCVEFGVLHGYSTMFVGGALQDNGKGHLFAYDRWPAHRPSQEEETRASIKRAGLTDWVTIETCNVEESPPHWDSIDYLFMDIDNCGSRLKWVLDRYGPKLSEKGIIVYEGGSAERDQVSWMIREDRVPIRQTLEALQGWDWYVIEYSPSITVLRPRK